MSLDKSLRKGSSMGRARNVLSRAERIAQLKEEDRWEDGQGALGLPKTRVSKAMSGKKKKKKKEEE